MTEETIDTPEFRTLMQAWSNAATECWPSKTLDGWNAIIIYIMDWHSAGVAAAVDTARVEATRIYMDMLKHRVAAAKVEGWQEREAHIIEVTAEQREAIAAAAREQALEEAAKRIEPSNPESDWTEYARVEAECAARIRALASQPAQPEAKQGNTTRQTDEVPTLQDIMFEVFEYSHISDGINETVGEVRDNQRNLMLAQDRKIRRMLEAFKSAAAALVQDEYCAPSGTGECSCRKFGADPTTCDNMAKPDLEKAARDMLRVLRAVEAGDDSQWPLIANACANVEDALSAPVAAPTPVAAPVLTDAAKRLHAFLDAATIPDLVARQHTTSGTLELRLSDIEAALATQAERQPQPAGKAVREVIRAINSDSGEGWSEQDEDAYWTQLLAAIQQDQQDGGSDA